MKFSNNFIEVIFFKALNFFGGLKLELSATELMNNFIGILDEFFS